MSGFVYFVQHGAAGVIKIGFTSCNVGGRFTQLQRAAPDELVFRGYIEGGYELEQDLHSRFAEHRHRGEWFRPAPELLEFIAENVVTDDLDVVLRKDLRSAIGRSQRAKWPRHLKKEFDPYAGEYGALVSAWREGTAAPSARMVAYYEKFLTDHDLWPSDMERAS